MITAAAVVIAALVWLTWLARPGLVAARILQIEEYEGWRLLAWSRRGGALARGALIAFLLAQAGGVAGLALGGAAAGAAGWALGAGWLHLTWRRPPEKKQLVLTSRIKRLLAAATLVALALTAGIAALLIALPPPIGSVGAAAACLVGAPLAALVVAAGTAVTEPIEALVRRHYRRRAEATVRAVDPTIVAVAGSYGKTSTKHILAALLEPHLPVLATPRSYNNLMGVTRTVNGLLRPEHRAFVVEMDAYAPGEIAEICRLTPPRVSLVTAVGPQHLERFGTLQAIEDALLETVGALPADGVAIVYAGDEPSCRLASRAASLRETVTYAFADERPDADVVVSDLRMSRQGSSFRWEHRTGGGRRRDLTCGLLGRHSALNVAAALAAVNSLGLPLEPSLDAVAGLVPAEHRLQPIPGASGITVIDDSYNANPIGVHNALEVLEAIEASARILVTPGLVELGPCQAEENRRFGRHAAEVCHHVVVVGSFNRRELVEGLREGGLAAERVHAVDSLDQATVALGGLTKPDAVVLFCNDLPDPYLVEPRP